jgi:hypothetical protein
LFKVKIVSASFNMVDVHVTRQSKANEEHVFKDKKPWKNKIPID